MKSPWIHVHMDACWQPPSALWRLLYLLLFLLIETRGLWFCVSMSFLDDSAALWSSFSVHTLISAVSDICLIKYLEGDKLFLLSLQRSTLTDVLLPLDSPFMFSACVAFGLLLFFCTLAVLFEMCLFTLRRLPWGDEIILSSRSYGCLLATFVCVMASALSPTFPPNWNSGLWFCVSMSFLDDSAALCSLLSVHTLISAVSDVCLLKYLEGINFFFSLFCVLHLQMIFFLLFPNLYFLLALNSGYCSSSICWLHSCHMLKILTSNFHIFLASWQESSIIEFVSFMICSLGSSNVWVFLPYTLFFKFFHK